MKFGVNPEKHVGSLNLNSNFKLSNRCSNEVLPERKVVGN
jgi:hypothetical protein